MKFWEKKIRPCYDWYLQLELPCLLLFLACLMRIVTFYSRFTDFWSLFLLDLQPLSSKLFWCFLSKSLSFVALNRYYFSARLAHCSSLFECDGWCNLFSFLALLVFFMITRLPLVWFWWFSTGCCRNNRSWSRMVRSQDTLSPPQLGARMVNQNGWVVVFEIKMLYMETNLVIC